MNVSHGSTSPSQRVPVDTLRPLYGFCDPHGGESAVHAMRLKRLASQAAICVGGMDQLGRIVVLDAWAGRVATDDLVDRLYATHEHWRLKSLGGEANALQGLFWDSVMRDARFRNRPLPIVKVLQPPTQEKSYRIRTILQPLWGNGRLLIADHCTTLIEQVTAFPSGMLWDQVDCLASLCRLIPPRLPRSDLDRETAAKCQYLRRLGVHPDVIAETARTGKMPDQSLA